MVWFWMWISNYVFYILWSLWSVFASLKRFFSAVARRDFVCRRKVSVLDIMCVVFVGRKMCCCIMWKVMLCCVVCEWFLMKLIWFLIREWNKCLKITKKNSYAFVWVLSWRKLLWCKLLVMMVWRWNWNLIKLMMMF